jgi:hypothetical protein
MNIGHNGWGGHKRHKEPSRKGHTLREVFLHLLSLTKDPAGQTILKKQIKILEERERYGSSKPTAP